eukprot:gene40169-49678_t
MSKAFTKESDNDDDEDAAALALAIPPGSKNYITPAGYQRIKDELLQLIDVDRPEVVRVVHWAASNGDRSENGDYIYGKKRLREIDRRIRFLTKRMDLAEVVNPSVHHGSDQVFFGATVTYSNPSGEERTVTIVGIDELDPLKGKISWISPVARTLTKAREGDTVTLHTPNGLPCARNRINRAASWRRPSARALEVTQSQSINTQLATNRANARSSLSQEEVALTSVTSLYQDVKELAVKAGAGSLTNKDRESIAVELEGRLQDLLGIANTADGSGGYIFSGFKDSIPFTLNGTGATYQGDQGERTLQIGSSRKVSISDSGSAIFENNITGNSKFQTGVDPANYDRGGTGIISPGAVTDPNALTGHQYAINFTVVPATPGVPKVTTYTVMDLTLGTPVPPAPDPADPIPYTSGKSISFDGLQFEIKGDPADLDSFTVDPSDKKSVFETIEDLRNAAPIMRDFYALPG